MQNENRSMRNENRSMRKMETGTFGKSRARPAAKIGPFNLLSTIVGRKALASLIFTPYSG